MMNASALRIVTPLFVGLVARAAVAPDANLGERCFEVLEDATPMNGGICHVVLQVVHGLVLPGLEFRVLVVVQFRVLGAQRGETSAERRDCLLGFGEHRLELVFDFLWSAWFSYEWFPSQRIDKTRISSIGNARNTPSVQTTAQILRSAERFASTCAPDGGSTRRNGSPKMIRVAATLKSR